jgi:endonuclease YncB( thermonuclease family)
MQKVVGSSPIIRFARFGELARLRSFQRFTGPRFLMLGMSVLVASVGLAPPLGESAAPSGEGGHHVTARVVEVIDGDTIRVRRRGARRVVQVVELIGTDAPEMKRPGSIECGGRQATSNMLQLTFTAPVDTDGDHFFDTSAGAGRRVTLTTDQTQGAFHERGPLFAYVATVGGTQLQLDQLARGWAKVHVGHRRFRRYRLFRRAQADAIGARHGVWSKCGGNFHRPA